MNFWNKLFGGKQPQKAPTRQTDDLQRFLTRLEGNPDANSFYEAAKEGDLENVKMMLKYNPDLVRCKTIFKTTPLHAAAAGGHKNVAEWLLANQADVHAKDSSGRTPLHWAAVNGHKDVAELLLANKAELNVKEENGETPFDLATAKSQDHQYPVLAANCESVAELLRQHGGHGH